MNLAKPVLLFVLMTLVVLAASTAIRYSVDRNIAAGTWNTVIRNWEQFGLLTLHGRLVDNPGGFEALDKPEVYPGHRATCVYLAFFVKRLFAWTGAGILAFSVAMSLIVFLSTWFLLGKSHAAWLVAAATLLSPGYVLWDAHLDPNAISVLLGLPFALWLISRLSQPRLSATAVTLLFAIILAFTSLNWTTVFVHGVLFGCLLAQRTLPRRRLLLFVALAGLSTLVVAGVSVLGKLSYASASGQSSNLKDFLAAYTLGGTGYGIGMTMAKAMVRLGFVNAMGLLPLLLVLGYVLAKHPRRDGANLWWASLPFCMSLLGLAAMRNYYAHHPWMAAPVLIVGLILSLRLVLPRSAPPRQTQSEPARGNKLLGPAGFLAASAAYATAVIMMSRLHNADSLAMFALVHDHTLRSDTLVLVKTLDPVLAGEAVGFAGGADRRVVVLNDLADHSDLGRQAFVISSTHLDGLPLVARSSEDTIASWPIVQESLAWYSRRIARRNMQDKPVGSAGPCYLYLLKSSQPPKVD